MHTLSFIQENDDWKEKLIDMGIKINNDPMFPQLINLCYDQIAATKTHPITMECRGLVIDTGNIKVQGRPFDRFFNIGEAKSVTDKINFNNCTVHEKLDGSLLKIYYSERYNTWLIGTKGTTTARNAITKYDEESGIPLLYLVGDALGISVDYHVSSYYTGYHQEFVDAGDYEIIMKLINEIVGSRLNRGYTYILELTSPQNNIVTRYDENALTLLGVRDNDSGEYVDHDVDIFKKPKTYHCGNLDEIHHALSKLNINSGKLNEGFVITCNDTGIRCKIKSRGYLAVHRNLNNESLDAMSIYEVVAEHDEDEVLAYYPELCGEFNVVVNRRIKAIEKIGKGISLFKEIDDRKELALTLKELGVASAVFLSMKNGLDDKNKAWVSLPTKMKIDLLKS